MIKTVSLPALLLALMAVPGMLAPLPQGGVGAINASFAAFDVPLCRTDAGNRQHRDQAPHECDFCLICVALHGQPVATPLLPDSNVLEHGASSRLQRQSILVSAAIEDSAPRGPHARAPPLTA
jgi:hypothetical protein